jgi:hypothetical protein
MAALRVWKRLTAKQRFWVVQTLWFACILSLALGLGKRLRNPSIGLLVSLSPLGCNAGRRCSNDNGNANSSNSALAIFCCHFRRESAFPSLGTALINS